MVGSKEKRRFGVRVRVKVHGGLCGSSEDLQADEKADEKVE